LLRHGLYFVGMVLDVMRITINKGPVRTPLRLNFLLPVAY